MNKTRMAFFRITTDAGTAVNRSTATVDRSCYPSECQRSLFRGIGGTKGRDYEKNISASFDRSGTGHSSSC